jgi:hypothetical protein
MSHPIPATPPCAASCSRIDLVPSRPAAVLGFAWLILVCVVALFTVALPWFVRLAICVAVAAPGIRTVNSFVLLQGRRAVRAIEWTQEGEFAVWIGPELAREAAALGSGSFRLGVECWVLRFVTPSGTRPVLIVGSVQDVRAYRRLCRCLALRRRWASGR